VDLNCLANVEHGSTTVYGLFLEVQTVVGFQCHSLES